MRYARYRSLSISCTRASLCWWRSESGSHPEREAGALELLSEPWLASFAGVVPDLAADLVQRVGGELDDMERVQAHLCVGAALADRDRDPVGHIAGDELDLFAARRCRADPGTCGWWPCRGRGAPR